MLHLIMSFSSRLNRALLAESSAVCDSCFIVLPSGLKGWACCTYSAIIAVGFLMYLAINNSQIK